MTVTEEQLRTEDLAEQLGLPEPDMPALDRLEAEGHAPYGFCEKCWAKSGNSAARYIEVVRQATTKAMRRPH